MEKVLYSPFGRSCKKFGHDPQKVLQLILTVVQDFLKNTGKRLKDYGLLYLCIDHETTMQGSRDLIDALNAPLPETCNTAMKLLDL